MWRFDLDNSTLNDCEWALEISTSLNIHMVHLSCCFKAALKQARNGISYLLDWKYLWVASLSWAV
jgi:hypothetical protein